MLYNIFNFILPLLMVASLSMRQEMTDVEKQAEKNPSLLRSVINQCGDHVVAFSDVKSGPKVTELSPKIQAASEPRVYQTLYCQVVEMFKNQVGVVETCKNQVGMLKEENEALHIRVHEERVIARDAEEVREGAMRLADRSRRNLNSLRSNMCFLSFLSCYLGFTSLWLIQQLLDYLNQKA